MKIDVVAWRAGFEPDINGDVTRKTPFFSEILINCAEKAKIAPDHPITN
jgi:hypothetical protein